MDFLISALLPSKNLSCFQRVAGIIGKVIIVFGVAIIMTLSKGSIRYYGKPGWDKLIRVDYHGSKEVPKGTCHAILKAAGIKSKVKGVNND
jgi:hypothetical protein